MGDYLYCTFENGCLRTRGLHHHGFPLLLWDALVQIGYGYRAPEYYGQLHEEHGLQRCEVYVNILSHPVFPDGSPWSTWAIGADMDDAMERAAHMALAALCEVYGEGCSHGTRCILSRNAPTQSGRLAWMRWVTSFRFTTIVAGCTWLDMPSTCSSCTMTLSASLRSNSVV
jgi:hypothetical protein